MHSKKSHVLNIFSEKDHQKSRKKAEFHDYLRITVISLYGCTVTSWTSNIESMIDKIPETDHKS